MGVIRKGLEHFLWQEFSLDTPSKDFYLAIGGGLGWMKWLKNAAEKGFIFHAVIPAMYPFCLKFIGLWLS